MPEADEPTWEPYDSAWLVALAQAQHPKKKWLHAAIAACTRARAKTCCAPKVCGYYFVDPTRPNKPGSDWQYATTIWLSDHDEGRNRTVLLDILKGRRVGGVQFG